MEGVYGENRCESCGGKFWTRYMKPGPWLDTEGIMREAMFCRPCHELFVDPPEIRIEIDPSVDPAPSPVTSGHQTPAWFSEKLAPLKSKRGKR